MPAAPGLRTGDYALPSPINKYRAGIVYLFLSLLWALAYPLKVVAVGIAGEEGLKPTVESDRNVHVT